MTFKSWPKVPVRAGLPQAQRGAVMIAALIVASLVVALAVGLAVSHERSLLRAEARFHGSQAKEYLLGAEQLALFALAEDYKDDKENGEFTDTLDEAWAQELTFPLDEGFMQGQLTDAQSKFDVNRLAVTVNQQNKGPTSFDRFTEDQRRFLRLLQALDDENPMSLTDAIELLEAIVDWIDADDTNFGFGGAESLYYQRYEPPIKPPNGPLVSITELRLVKGMTPEIFDALAPFITALPEGGGLNVNTANVMLLRTINLPADLTPLALADAEEIELQRGGLGYQDIAEFSASLPPALTSRGDLSTDGLTVDSGYFVLSTQVEVGRQRRSLLSLLHREDDNTEVVRHSDFVL
ncbi:type II secretion system minor pseudopilin GspK [Halioxenophilus sp. WMMB6]|uniref:type II secretion system minor pseudopilin GspK n=1 Tax=Halioxenophilus sp. WMMB6 TaxID=3073815 RepID=UPI00295EF639|nr:type II secretion system minor pseudopilin GspK [Halioxenophilus sp. WMMB6]